MVPVTLEQAAANPSKPLSWRWQAAKWIRKHPTVEYSIEDRLVLAAIDYLSSNDRSRFPLIHTARTIFAAEGLARAEIETRILSGQSDAEIAERCRVPAELVTAYEHLFFAARSRRTSDWVRSNTVGDACYRGFRNHELPQLWAWLALSGGPVIVDQVISVFRAAVQPGDKLAVDVYLRGNSIPADLKLLIAVNVIPSNDFGDKWLHEFGHRLTKAETIKNRKRSEVRVGQVKKRMIEFARKVLVGEPLPKPPRPKPSLPMPIGRSFRSASYVAVGGVSVTG